jgi:hypothetical protein
VLLPALIVFPLFLPFAQGRSLSPLLWQPVTLPDWLSWWLERGVPAGDDMPVFDSSLSWIRQLATYARTLRLDYTLSVVVIAIFGMTVLLRRRPVTVTFLLVTYVLVAALGVNSQGAARPFITYLPSFVLLVYAYGIGLSECRSFMNERIEARSMRVRLPEALIGFALVAGILLVQLRRAYPLQRSEAIFGQPLDVYRQVLKSGDMGDRLAARMGDLPPKALVLADWEQLTILWYKQKVEGLRPDLTLIYPIDRLEEFAGGDRPLCLARLLPVSREWHPANIGPLVCLSHEPGSAVPEGFTRLGTSLFTPEREPRLELVAYRIDRTTLASGQYIPLVLAWRALMQHPEDYSISLHILTEDWQQVWAQDIAAPVLGMYPTSRWVQGEVVTDYHELAIPPTMAPGRYLWTVVIYRRLADGSFAQLRDARGNIEVLGGTFEVVAR